MKPTKFTNEAELQALFDHAVRAIGFYEGCEEQPESAGHRAFGVAR